MLTPRFCAVFTHIHPRRGVRSPLFSDAILMLFYCSLPLSHLALLLMQRNATVTIAHSRTKNLEEIIRRADIVVAAVGRAEMVKVRYTACIAALSSLCECGSMFVYGPH